MGVIPGITAHFQESSSGSTELLSLPVAALFSVTMVCPQTLELHQKQLQSSAQVCYLKLSPKPMKCPLYVQFPRSLHGDFTQQGRSCSPAADGPGGVEMSRCRGMITNRSVQSHPRGCSRERQRQSPSQHPLRKRLVRGGGRLGKFSLSHLFVLW